MYIFLFLSAFSLLLTYFLEFCCIFIPRDTQIPIQEKLEKAIILMLLSLIEAGKKNHITLKKKDKIISVVLALIAFLDSADIFLWAHVHVVH